MTRTKQQLGFEKLGLVCLCPSGGGAATALMVFPLPEALLKTLAKNLVNNLANKLVKILAKNLINNHRKHMF